METPPRLLSGVSPRSRDFMPRKLRLNVLLEISCCCPSFLTEFRFLFTHFHQIYELLDYVEYQELYPEQ